MSKKSKASLTGRPAGPRMLVKIKQFEEISEAGIVLSSASAKVETFNATRGVVVKLGLDCYNEVFHKAVGCKEPWCEVGDEILFKSHASYFPDDLDEGYIVINDQDVLWNYSKE